MTDDELKRTEAWAVMVHNGGEPAKFAVYATVHDLTAEIRRLQRQLAEAVAANLCHISLKADERLAERYREAVSVLAGVAHHLNLDPSALAEDPSVVLMGRQP